MRGAAEEGGTVVGILADRLERAAVQRDNRGLLMDGRLVLISPYDPSAGFNVGHAMQRNKLIYALSDAALVVNADLNKGGTWAGAVEQLGKLRLVPVYVRSNGSPNSALEALVRKGARTWPDPASPEQLERLLSQPAVPQEEQLSLAVRESEATAYDAQVAEDQGSGATSASADTTPAEQLMSTVRALIEEMSAPIAVKNVAADLDVSESQARAWLERLVTEGTLEKGSRPVRYERRSRAGDLFGQGD
jgi:DNA processing protein